MLSVDGKEAVGDQDGCDEIIITLFIIIYIKKELKDKSY